MNCFCWLVVLPGGFSGNRNTHRTLKERVLKGYAWKSCPVLRWLHLLRQSGSVLKVFWSEGLLRGFLKQNPTKGELFWDCVHFPGRKLAKCASRLIPAKVLLSKPSHTEKFDRNQVFSGTFFSMRTLGWSSDEKARPP